MNKLHRRYRDPNAIPNRVIASMSPKPAPLPTAHIALPEPEGGIYLSPAVRAAARAAQMRQYELLQAARAIGKQRRPGGTILVAGHLIGYHDNQFTSIDKKEIQ